MLKFIRNIIIVMTALLMINSCQEDFLTEEPRDEIYADNLFQSYDGFQAAVNSLRNLTRRIYSEPGTSTATVAFLQIGTDMAWANYTFSHLYPFTRYGTNVQSTDSRLNRIFNWLYDIVNSSNMVITRAAEDEINWQGGSQSQNEKNKNEVIALARFYRAWAYRHLTYLWGDVPLSTEEINGSNYSIYWPRAEKESIYTQMEEDLLFAEQHLPDNYNNPLILPNALAQHYLAELYLLLGENELAEQKAMAAATNANFSLVTQRYGVKANQPGVPFMDMFQDGNVLPTDGNTEVLWAHLSYPDVSTGRPGDSDPEGAMRMRRTYVNRYYYLTSDDIWAFLNYGGRGIGRVTFTHWTSTLYEEGDDRYSEFAVRKYYLKEAGGDTVFTAVDPEQNTKDRYWPSTRKWDWVANDEAKAKDARQFGDLIYVRLAETYLLLSEAAYKNGKPDVAAEYINKIRMRANATPITAGDVDMEFILEERARELLLEEERRHTLNRLGLLVERAKMYNPQSTDIAEHNVLMPLPQNFIDANQGDTPQNPGY